MQGNSRMLKRFIILSVAIISCVAFEQQTKVWAQEWLQQGVSVKCLSGIFQFILAENQGAFLGLGAQIPEFMRIVIFTGIIPACLLAGFIWVVQEKDLTLMGSLAAVLLIAGGISNVIDRTFNHGAVIDFMYLDIGPLHTGIFNVADIFIMTAVFIMVCLSFSQEKSARN